MNEEVIGVYAQAFNRARSERQWSLCMTFLEELCVPEDVRAAILRRMLHST